MSANKKRLFFLKGKLTRASGKKAEALRKEIAELTGTSVAAVAEVAPVVEAAPVVETVEVVAEKPAPAVKPKAKRSYRRKKTTTTKE